MGPTDGQTIQRHFLGHKSYDKLNQNKTTQKKQKKYRKQPTKMTFDETFDSLAIVPQ